MFIASSCLLSLFVVGQAKAEPMPEVKKNQLPHTKLAPAKLVPDLCMVKYRVSTASPDCQAFYDQGIGYFQGYVYMEAARSFETALKHDPECALAWWGLSLACNKWGKAQAGPPLEKAKELLAKASPRERLLIRARLQEKGLIDNLPDDRRKKEATKTLDELISIYEEDEEGWYQRGLISDGNAAIPFYKALLRINPNHAGAHHELIHLYENMKRPALGWPHAEGFLYSSPRIPHAWHMQAHLATRMGRWDKTTDRSVRAIELEEEYHRFQEVKPKEDEQFAHHVETLLQGLTHDGRFQEALALVKKCEVIKVEHPHRWFQLHAAQHDWPSALKVVEKIKKDASLSSYLRAVAYLALDDYDKSCSAIDELRDAFQTKRNDKDIEMRLWETEGLLRCGKDMGVSCTEAGLWYLSQVADRSKDMYARHSWGHGGDSMEVWGLAALRAQRFDLAEEAYLEALAHDSGSVRGALGMQIVCEKLSRAEEARRFADLARRIWRRADPGAIEHQLEFLRQAARKEGSSDVQK